MPKVQTPSHQLGYWRFGNCGNCDNCLSPNPVEDWTIEAMKFLLCGALQRTIWDESHYRAVARKIRKSFSTGITIFLLMASAKIKI